MEIENKQELDDFFFKSRVMGHDVIGVKGTPPPGMKYEDGITVYIAWKNIQTGEQCNIKYI